MNVDYKASIIQVIFFSFTIYCRTASTSTALQSAMQGCSHTAQPQGQQIQSHLNILCHITEQHVI